MSGAGSRVVVDDTVPSSLLENAIIMELRSCKIAQKTPNSLRTESTTVLQQQWAPQSLGMTEARREYEWHEVFGVTVAVDQEAIAALRGSEHAIAGRVPRCFTAPISGLSRARTLRAAVPGTSRAELRTGEARACLIFLRCCCAACCCCRCCCCCCCCKSCCCCCNKCGGIRLCVVCGAANADG